MWSLGCIAAELYTHRLLFDNSSVANLLTSASALLEPVPECLLLMAGVKVLQSEGRFFVALKKGGVWDIDPPHVSLERELWDDPTPTSWTSCASCCGGTRTSV